jgi:ferritin-like protein
MSSENLHAPRERLSKKALLMHHAIVSVMEELDAIDWYRQRADDTEDETLKEILLHNMREEMEHACMILEWLRRYDSDFDGFMRTYLFTEAPILEVEDIATAEGETPDAPPKETLKRPPPAGAGRRPGGRRGFTIGSLKKD